MILAALAEEAAAVAVFLVAGNFLIRMNVHCSAIHSLAFRFVQEEGLHGQWRFFSWRKSLDKKDKPNKVW
jgi:hypothetical protein